jgi:hypothetical protein
MLADLKTFMEMDKENQVKVDKQRREGRRGEKEKRGGVKKWVWFTEWASP